MTSLAPTIDRPTPPADATRRRPRTLRLAAGAVGLLLLAGAAGCSDDESTAAAADASDFCASAVDFSAAMGGAPQDPEAMAGFVAEVLQPATAALTSALPSDLEGAGSTLTDAVDQAASTGDPSALFGPEGAGAQAEIGAAVHEDCDLQRVEVHAVEYAFHGVPTSLDAGVTSFELVNDGVEEHEMVLFRLADGETATFAELMELPEEEAMAKMQFTGVAFGGPDSTSYVTADLEPGTYFLVCFIPVGGGEEGPPHFMEGMQQTVTVS